MTGRKWAASWISIMILGGAGLVGDVQAGAMTVNSTFGNLVGFQDNNGDGILETQIFPPDISLLNTLLQGDSSNNGGGVLVSSGSSISGTVDGDLISLSGLTSSDWFGASNLAERFISDAAASVGVGLTSTEIDEIKNAFETGGYWSAVSNPYIGYVSRDQGVLKVGLQGHLNATPVLQAIFNPLFSIKNIPLIPNTAQYQVSDVVKVTYQGSDYYLYGFDAIASTAKYKNPSSYPQYLYTGLYEVTIPEPKTWSLILSALFALAGVQVLRSRSA
ncbi:NF038130 family PEP-CTERM protein [Allochromatium vinosum]|uniref:NF038130 family PEP-CTERM protein n=1 Tax=Allochromatium vinosum TaxID=1049 RepID=UPI001904EDD7|nr:NF038130 family PEP-CTERM protein [Allochromatium vinosum]